MLESLKVLIVDDEPLMLSLLKGILQESEINNIVTANSGRYALEILKQKKFDLAFLDINLPDIDGIELLREIKKDNTDMRVIMISGSSTPENVNAAQQEGAQFFIAKPYNSKKILSTLKKVADM